MISAKAYKDKVIFYLLEVVIFRSNVYSSTVVQKSIAINYFPRLKINWSRKSILFPTMNINHCLIETYS
jgi:hypothetical protein